MARFVASERMLSPEYPIATERLRLRPFGPGDLDALVAIHGDPEVVRYLYDDVRDRDALREVVEKKAHRNELRKAGDALNLAAVLAATGELVGDVVLFWHSEEHRSGEVGYIFNRAFAGRGYATEAARALLRLGFEELGLHRITGRLDARNTASARVLERLGMRREAHLVENERVKGEWADEVVYAMLDREWAAAQAATPASRADVAAGSASKRSA
jgi:RimJ/RimL family protein N-acetyltransferase